ncbi:MAG: hypothetical protein HYZ00_00755 [Candidatus Hydrogenedentes bacterium]|nr:hypothetical protein [Candidatus Hydrogenedentota bacterium]
MNTFLLNAVAVVVALVLLFGVWIGVHLLARRRMGERKLGCRGPTFDEQGNSVCCHSGQPCDRIEDARHAD